MEEGSFDAKKAAFDNFVKSRSTNSGIINKHGGFCSVCGSLCDKIAKCSACEVVTYCGTECQKKDWKTHKKQCATILEKPLEYFVSTYDETKLYIVLINVAEKLLVKFLRMFPEQRDYPSSTKWDGLPIAVLVLSRNSTKKNSNSNASKNMG